MQQKLNTVLLGLIALSLAAIALSLIHMTLKPQFQPILKEFGGSENVILLNVNSGKTFIYRAESDKLVPISAAEGYD